MRKSPEALALVAKCEPLEQRVLLAAVTWDGGGGDLLWSNPLNWSGDLLPGPTDDVTLNADGNVTVEFDSGASTIASLQLDDSLELTGGSLVITGDTSVSSGKELVASGPSTSLVADNVISLDGVNLSVSGGAEMTFNGVTSLTNT
ncbi:MAG: hypothetical protein KDA93_25805, partial [Planctomycetaceae bacterium]|nr:hypothetical protein [Planctomycetaceae bacterium]